MAFVQLLAMIMLAVSPALSALTGEPCRDDYDCAYGQQECIKRFDECETKACFCKPDYGGRFTTDCEKDLDLADRCRDRGDHLRCPDHSYCDSDLDLCIARIKAGSPCTSDGTSCTSEADCVENICTCGSSYKKVDGRCVPLDFGDECSSTYYCRSNYECRGTEGSPSTCQCRNSTYTQLTYREEGADVTSCVHAQATKGVEVGGDCRLGDVSNYGKICGSGLTCSRCLDEDSTTCITPTGGADGVKAGFAILTAALLLTQLM